MHELGGKYNDISTIMASIGMQFNAINERSKIYHYNNFLELMNKMNEHFIESSKIYTAFSTSYENEWQIAIQILDKEMESHQDVAKRAGESYSQYNKAKQVLQSKKDKLFESKNVNQWKMKDAQCDLNSKLEAQKLMLPKVP